MKTAREQKGRRSLKTCSCKCNHKKICLNAEIVFCRIALSWDGTTRPAGPLSYEIGAFVIGNSLSPFPFTQQSDNPLQNFFFRIS